MMGNNLGKLCISLTPEGKLPADKPKQISRHSKAKSTVKPRYNRRLLQTEEDPRKRNQMCFGYTVFFIRRQCERT